MNAWKTMLVVLGATALTATAQPNAPRGGAGGPGDRPEHMQRGMDIAALLDNEDIVEKLGLTDEQVAALKARAAESEKKFITLRADVELAETDVRHLMREDKPDREALMKAVETAGQAMTNLRKALVEEQLAFREIAGPDALRKARHMIAKQWRKDGGNRPFMRGARGPAGEEEPQQPPEDQ